METKKKSTNVILNELIYKISRQYKVNLKTFAIVRRILLEDFYTELKDLSEFIPMILTKSKEDSRLYNYLLKETDKNGKYLIRRYVQKDKKTKKPTGVVSFNPTWIIQSIVKNESLILAKIDRLNAADKKKKKVTA